MIDLLDGTKKYIKRNGVFIVNIALIEEEQTVFSVVYAPVLDKLHYGGKGIGGFLIEKGVEKHLTKKERSADLVKIVASRSDLNQETQDFIDRLDKVEKIVTRSSLNVMIVAEENVDYYSRFTSTMEWNTAASYAVNWVVGCKVETVSANRGELVYNKKKLFNADFVASRWI